MATNWITLTGADLAQVMSQAMLDQANANIGPDVNANDAFDPDLPTRADAIVASAVLQLRANVQTAGRTAVSLTPGSVPPDAVRHVLNLAAGHLLQSTPNVQMVVVEGQPVFMRLYDAAVKYFEEVARGSMVVDPTDPCGQDYQTAVSSTNPAVCGVSWQDDYAADSDYAVGTVGDNAGGKLTLPLDNLSTDPPSSSLQ